MRPARAIPPAREAADLQHLGTSRTLTGELRRGWQLQRQRVRRRHANGVSLLVAHDLSAFGKLRRRLPGLGGQRTVTLANTGNASITITSVATSKSGDDPDDLKARSFCSATLAAGESCRIIVTFIADRDNYSPSRTLIITDSAAGSPQSVPLGPARLLINPRARLSSDRLDFGKQKVGTTSAAQTATLTNTGTTSLAISTLTVKGEFALAAGTTCSDGGTVTLGASCRIEVTFTPTAPGEHSGSLTIKDNTRRKERIVRALSGTGELDSGPANK